MWLHSSISDCPNCHTKNLRLLLLKSQHPGLIKLCKQCQYRDSHVQPLPTLDKKVISLDQNFISNILKIQKPIYIRDKSSQIPHASFYQEAWERMTELYKLQVIIIPYSLFLKIESAAFNKKAFENQENSGVKMVPDIQQVYEKLSGGISFYDPWSIYKKELISEYQHVFAGENKLTVDDILHGNRNEWLKKYFITLPISLSDYECEDYKNKITQNLNDFLTSFKGSEIKNYDQCYKTLIELLVSCLKIDQSPELKNALRLEISIVQKQELIKDFLQNNIRNIPTIKIMASIITTLIKDFMYSDRKSVDNGMFNDINRVSSLLPFCDAIWVDKEMHNLLNFKHTKHIIDEYQHKIFSLNNQQEFLNYLDNLRKSTSSLHNELVDALYK
jgi:hypothetical protein